MEELGVIVTLEAGLSVTWQVIYYNHLGRPAAHYHVTSGSLRGAQKQVTERLRGGGWSPVGRWNDGTRTFTPS